VKLSLLAGGRFYGASRKSLNQEKILFSMLDGLLRPQRAGLPDISTLCVVSGPGRFTGLRVGLTLASALKTLAGVKVYTCTLFEILAAQAAASREFRAWASFRKEPRLAVITHAFKDEYFCQLFTLADRKGKHAGSMFTPVEGPRWLKGEETAEYIKSAGEEIYAIADAEEKPDIYSLVPAGTEKAAARISKILPGFVIRAGLALKNRDLTPLYLKPAKYELDAKPRVPGKTDTGRKI